jgi:hypothetical protein
MALAPAEIAEACPAGWRARDRDPGFAVSDTWWGRRFPGWPAPSADLMADRRTECGRSRNSSTLPARHCLGGADGKRAAAAQRASAAGPASVA